MLKAYGLEYKFITMYLEDLIHYDQMVSQLNTAIHQFAKRQMTWFRRMERNGVNIHWLRGEDGVQVNLNKVLSLLENSSE
jgi:tRNA dimethylallyltransferase